MNNFDLLHSMQQDLFKELLQKLILNFPIQLLEKKYIDLILSNSELFHTFLVSSPSVQKVLLENIEPEVLHSYIDINSAESFFKTITSWIDNGTISDKDMIPILQPLIYKLEQSNKRQFIKKLVEISPIFISPSQGLINISEDDLIDLIDNGLEVQISRWKKYQSNLNIIEHIIKNGHIKDFKSINPLIIFDNPHLFQQVLQSEFLYDEFLDVVETSMLPKNHLNFIIDFFITNLSKYPLTLKRIKFFKYHISHQEKSQYLFTKLKINVIDCLNLPNPNRNPNHIFATYFLMDSDDDKLFLLEKLLEFNTPPFNKLYLSNIQIVLQNILTDKPFKDEFYSLVGYHDFLNFHKVLGVNPIHFLMYATKDENDARKPLELKTQKFLDSCLQTLQYFYLRNNLSFNENIAKNLTKKVQKI